MAIAALVVEGFYEGFITSGLISQNATPPTISDETITPGVFGATITGTVSDDNFPIMVYAVRLADGASAPSALQVIAGTDASDTPVSSASITVSVAGGYSVALGGASANTAYDAYRVAVDDLGNPTTVQKYDFTTKTIPVSTLGTQTAAVDSSVARDLHFRI